MMKPNYKNWAPTGLVVSMIVGTVVAGALLAAVSLTELLSGTPRLVVRVILWVLFVVLLVGSVFCLNWHSAFSYTGKRQISRRVIERVSDYVKLPEGGVGLDVGCGSGALTIACARKNPQGRMIGLDRWGKEYASFNRPLCERNAEIEGVSGNTAFVRGDACKLDFPDEQFDAVTSNYCYHNIPSLNRQAIILETLRVLKKGGTFAIHDVFIREKYGDLQKLLDKLKEMGYAEVKLLDTTDGLILSRKEAWPLFLVGSALLVGKK